MSDLIDTNIKVVEVEKYWNGKTVKPVSAVVRFARFSEEEYIHYESYDRFCNQFQVKLTNKGKIYVNNSHINRKTKNGKYRCQSLLLTSQDLHIYEKIFNHWKEISQKFIKVISIGGSMIGHIETRYFFPDKTEYTHVIKDPKSKALERIEGKSIDDKFSSEGCKYISEYPYEQHYKEGRLDYYLLKHELVLEDDKTIQVLEDKQPDIVLKFLKYVASFKNPEHALLKLLRIGD